MIVDTMITPPFEWKPMIGPKPTLNSDPSQLMHPSILPSLACVDLSEKIQETLSADKMRHPSVEISDWKYKFKTSDLIRIPLSHIIADPDENRALRLTDENVDCFKWTHTETGKISNENDSLAQTISAKTRGRLSKRSQNNCKLNSSCVLAMPSLRGGSIVNISSPINYGNCGGFIRDTIGNLRQCITGNHFGNMGMKRCNEISKTKFEEIQKAQFEFPFSDQSINSLEKNFRYKVNASQLPRSETPVNEKDPDKISFKKVASFLSDDLGSNISVDYKDQSDLETSAMETVNYIPSSDIPSGGSVEFCNHCPSGPGLKFSENSEAMNLVNADVFTSPSRSMHSSGAFKTSFRLRRAPKLRTKTMKEKDPPNARPQNESKQRLKLQKFLDFAVSTRESTSLKDSFTSVTSSGEFLQVPSLHVDHGKQGVSETAFENCQEPKSGWLIDIRKSSASRSFSEKKDCDTLAEISKPRQYTLVYFDKKTDYKKISVQKSKSDLSGVLVKDQTWPSHVKSWKNSENGSAIKSGQSVVVIPACTPMVNDGGNTSDSEFISESVDQLTADAYCSRLSSSTNFGLNTPGLLNPLSSLTSVFSQKTNDASNQRYRNQNDEQEHLFTTEPKEYSPVKLSFRKEKIMFHKNSEFLNKFFNSENGEHTKMNNSVCD